MTWLIWVFIVLIFPEGTFFLIVFIENMCQIKYKKKFSEHPSLSDREYTFVTPVHPASILYKSTAGRYRPVRYPDGPITARYRFIKNAYWVTWSGVTYHVTWIFQDHRITRDESARSCFCSNDMFIIAYTLTINSNRPSKCRVDSSTTTL